MKMCVSFRSRYSTLSFRSLDKRSSDWSADFISKDYFIHKILNPDKVKYND